MKTNLPTVKVKNLILREINSDDYLDLFECGKSSLMCETLNWGPFYRLFEAKYVINEIYLKRPENGLPIGYGIILADTLIGVVDYHSYDDIHNSIEIGYFLNPSYWNKGIMTKAVKEAIKIAFNHLEVDKVIIGGASDNIKSLNLIKRLGLKYEYEMINEYKDENHLCYYYSIYKNEFKGE
ncbi:MAG: GNAT family N-acetyltransferase [Acholeplasmatales bacterium]|nr:GNAT family N-acetyltransferase [Acholeplasmatales bacterium]